MSYTISQANLDKDKNTILKFWRENQPRALDEKYKWIYKDNPAGKAEVWMVNHNESRECVGLLMTSFLRHVRSLAPESLMINLLENNHIITKMRRFGFM